MSEQDGNFPVGESRDFDVGGYAVTIERADTGIWHRRDIVRTAYEITGVIERAVDGYEAGYLTNKKSGLAKFDSWNEAMRYVASLPVSVVDDN